MASLSSVHLECPSVVLSKIALKLGVQEDALHTLTIPSSSYDLYHAVLEYAALVPSLDDSLAIPLRIPDKIQTSHIVPRLKIKRSNGTLMADMQEEEEDERQLAPALKKVFGLGMRTLIWPPTKGLLPENIPGRGACAIASDATSSNESTETENSASAGTCSKVSDTDLPRQKLLYVSHYSHRATRQKKSEEAQPSVKEILLATTEPDFLPSFAQEILQWRIDKDLSPLSGGTFHVYRLKTMMGASSWVPDCTKRARPADSVVLKSGQMDEILSDVEEFLSPVTKEWYTEHGLPQRRSFLFYGPPGTGKTSTIQVVASKFRLKCCYLALTDSSFSNDILADSFKHLPPRALVILEDVDSLFNMDRRSNNSSSLTFSGLLNALDGVISTEGIITVLTTNHIERLDQALLRGGRVDRKFLFSAATKEQLTRLFLKFYKTASSGLASRFADAILDRSRGECSRSVADLQQLFIRYRSKSAEECVQGTAEFFDSYHPSGQKKDLPSLYS